MLELRLHLFCCFGCISFAVVGQMCCCLLSGDAAMLHILQEHVENQALDCGV